MPETLEPPVTRQVVNLWDKTAGNRIAIAMPRVMFDQMQGECGRPIVEFRGVPILVVEGQPEGDRIEIMTGPAL